MKKILNYLFPILALCFGLFIIYIIYAAGTGTPNFFFRLIGKIPYGDKLGHFILMGSMTLILNLALKIRKVNLAQRKILLGSLIIFIIISLEEFSQIFLARRNFDLVDLFFNYLGIIVFSYISIMIGKRIWKNEK